MSALLTSETGNTAKVVKYINECREMGIQVLPPDVNKSDKDFTPDGEAIRFGLCAIKNVGGGAVESIITARNEGGPFTSIYNFCERVDLSGVNRRMIESLIKAGAMDSLNGTRSQLFAVIDSAMETGQRAQRDKLSGQTVCSPMALGADEEQHPEPPLAQSAGLDRRRESSPNEKEMLGFYVTGHPLDEWMDKVCELATHTSDTLEGLERGRGCRDLRHHDRHSAPPQQGRQALGDVPARRQGRRRRRHGLHHQYEQVLPMLAEDKAVLIRGMALPEEGAPTKMSVQDIIPLEVARVPMPSLISIKVRLGTNGTDKARGARTRYSSASPATPLSGCASKGRGTSRLFWM